MSRHAYILGVMKKGRSILAVIAGMLIVCVFAALLLYRAAVAPADSQRVDKISFVVPKGKSIIWIGESLQDKGLLKSARAFRFEVWRLGIGSKIQAGTFELSPSMTPAQIADTLTKGTNDVWVTLLEGWRAEEVADALSAALGESFDSKEFLALAKNSEGMLFPDTYLVPKTMTAKQAYALLTNTFEKKLDAAWEEKLQKSGKSKEQAIIMASLIQREAKTLPTMRMISGILWKRIESGWPLQVDATLQYAKGYSQSEKSWWPEPLAVYKEIKSPFNTYLNTGLPPAPICNPGMNALEAAVNPQANDYWYYISDLQGQMHYAKTLQEHNRNVEQYLR